MFNKVFLALVAGAVSTFSVGSASAALIGYEPFDYGSGSSVAGQTGGTGNAQWTAGWSASGSSATVEAPGMSFGSLVVDGNYADSTGGASTIDFRNTGTIGSGDVWISFLARADDAAAASTFFGLSLYDGPSTAVGAIQRWPGGNRWAVASGGSSDDAGDTLVVGQTYFLVAHVNFDDLGDTFDLYVDSTPGGPLPGTPDATLTGLDLEFDRIRVASAGGANWSYDEIRIGTTFEDVSVAVPEPTALLLAGSLSLVTLCSRRKK